MRRLGAVAAKGESFNLREEDGVPGSSGRFGEGGGDEEQ